MALTQRQLEEPIGIDEGVDTKISKPAAPIHPRVKTWLANPEFSALDYGSKQRVLTNFFNRELANNAFFNLPAEEQSRIQNNFLTAHIGESPQPPTEGLKEPEYIDKANFDELMQGKTEGPGIIETVKGEWKRGKAQATIGELSFEEMVSGPNEERTKKIEELNKIASTEQEDPAGFVASSFGAASKMAPLMFRGILEGQKKGITAGMALGGITAAAGQAGPQIATPEEIITVPVATAAGYTIGTAYGAAEYIYRAEAGLAYDEFKREGIDPKIAKKYATVVGGINSIIEIAQIGVLLKTIPGLKNAVVKGVVKKAMQNKSIGNALMRVAGRYAKFLGIETGQEELQESTNIIMGEFAKQANNELMGTDIPAATRKEIIDRLKDTGVESLKAFMVMGLPGGAIQTTQAMAGGYKAKEAYETPIDQVTQELDETQDILDEKKPEKIPPKEVDRILEKVAPKTGLVEPETPEGGLRVGPQRTGPPSIVPPEMMEDYYDTQEEGRILRDQREEEEGQALEDRGAIPEPAGREEEAGTVGEAQEGLITALYKKSPEQLKKSEDQLKLYSERAKENGLDEDARNADDAIKVIQEVQADKEAEAKPKEGLKPQEEFDEAHYDKMEGLTLPETITEAAVKTKDGEIYTGKTHTEAFEDIPSEIELAEDDGFMTSKGRYVTRKEANELVGNEPDEIDADEIVGKEVKAEEEPKSYDAIQKEIDDLESKLLDKGIPWDEINKSPEVERLYELRNQVGQKELEQSYDEISDVVDEVTQDEKLRDKILNNVYSLNKKESTGQYFAAEYTQNQVSNRKDTREKIFNIVTEDYGDKNNVDIGGIFSNISGLTKSGQRDLLKRLTNKAAAIENSVYEYFHGKDVIKSAEEEKPSERSEDNESKIVNPIDLNATQDEKAKQLKKLSRVNKPIIEEKLKDIRNELGLEAKSSYKLHPTIIEKANRPIIKSKKPWHDVEHIRDSFRFKAVIKSFEDIPKAVNKILEIPESEIVKVDTEKMLDPKEWGWRFVAFDLRMENGQLVEFYMPMIELEDAKKDRSQGPSNHDLFEKWRDTTDEDRITRAREYQQDLEESRSRYQSAWDSALNRLGLDEKAALASFNKMVASLPETGLKLSLRSSAEKVPVSQEPSTRIKGTDKPLSSAKTITRPSERSSETIIAETSKPIVEQKKEEVKALELSRNQKREIKTLDDKIKNLRQRIPVAMDMAIYDKGKSERDLEAQIRKATEKQAEIRQQAKPEKETPGVIETFTNEEEGTTAVVTKIDKGYSVTLRDDDAGKTLGVAHIYKDKKDAIEKAENIALHKEIPKKPAEMDIDEYAEYVKGQDKSGIEYTEEVEVEETGQIVKMKRDASEALREIDMELDALHNILDCLG